MHAYVACMHAHGAWMQRDALEYMTRFDMLGRCQAWSTMRTTVSNSRGKSSSARPSSSRPSSKLPMNIPKSGVCVCVPSPMTWPTDPVRTHRGARIAVVPVWWLCCHGSCVRGGKVLRKGRAEAGCACVRVCASLCVRPCVWCECGARATDGERRCGGARGWMSWRRLGSQVGTSSIGCRAAPGAIGLIPVLPSGLLCLQVSVSVFVSVSLSLSLPPAPRPAWLRHDASTPNPSCSHGHAAVAGFSAQLARALQTLGTRVAAFSRASCVAALSRILLCPSSHSPMSLLTSSSAPPIFPCRTYAARMCHVLTCERACARMRARGCVCMDACMCA